MYAELHCHSNYSFQEGASSIDELLTRAIELGYEALALTDVLACMEREGITLSEQDGSAKESGYALDLENTGSKMGLWVRDGSVR